MRVFSFFQRAVEETPPFTTQRSMLRRMGNPSLGGVCATLTNAWLNKRLENKEPDFLSNVDETIAVTLSEAVFQSQLIEEGRDPRDSAFIRHGTSFERLTVKRETLVEQDEFDKLVRNSRFSLFSIPTNSPHRHMVGFENNEAEDKCRIFDPDLPGGEITSPCKETKRAFSRFMDLNYPKEGSTAEVSRSYGI